MKPRFLDRLKKLKTLLRFRSFNIALIFLAFFFTPFLLSKAFFYSQRYDTLSNLPQADAIIIFGTCVRNQNVSPLMKQRLETGILLFENNKAETIVVSNTPEASEVMKQYLIKRGIPNPVIELDVDAIRTVDSCLREKRVHPQTRTLILVSQDYHLPRVSFQCWRTSRRGNSVPANLLFPLPSTSPWYTIFYVRSGRYLREAALMWFTLFRN